ncbi:MAG: PBP1A family penicillin-binding protein [Anaerolineae bacterium]|nr:PBP1A family penicillin-binding protein [Anaerolineae bacterium]
MTKEKTRRRPSARRLIVGGAVLAVLTGVAVGGYFWLFADLPDVEDLDSSLLVPSIRIVDRNDRLLYEVIGDEVGRHSVISLDDVPQACIDATVATEDAHFYTNPGVDARGVARAVWTYLQGGEVVSGGSTITQQVARNLLLEPDERGERTLRRKLREIILAYRLYRRYGKDHILALYLNQTYYGNLTYGIDAAARSYFDKPVSELDLAECALLAGLPQAPTIYDPLTDPEPAQERQSVVLGLMVEHGFLTEEQADIARREMLAFAAERYPIEAPHFVPLVYEELQETIPAEQLRQGGLIVRTSLDLDWQNTASEIVNRQIDLLNEPGDDAIPHNAHDAALVAMDPHTGQVLAMLGSPDYFDESISGAINMAAAPRQPGSTMKPFTYALAFDPSRSDPWTAATMILDVQTSFVTHEGLAYSPVNYDHLEHGPVLAREALASSYNIPAVIALNSVGVNELIRFMPELGISTLSNSDEYDLSITLGGGEVRLVELTAAYAAFANGGTQVRPVLILDVTDSDGQVIFEQGSGLGERVIDERVAWLITDILSDNLARAPSFTTHSILQIGRPAAVKTGTTTNFRDNWTVGYTPNLVVGVWVGNADNSSMVNVSGISGAGPIWHHFMRAVLRGQPELTFDQPPGLVKAEVCTLSGLLPGENCPYTRQEWFIAGTVPTETDPIYRRVEIDIATGLLADETTLPENHETLIVLDLPPEAHNWARREGLTLLADLQSGGVGETGSVDTTPALRIMSPDALTIYRLDPGLPPEAQAIPVVAAGSVGLHDVTIYIDDEPLITFVAPPFETWWPLEVGQHSVRADGVTSDGQPISSEVVWFSVNEP